jgi:hypothetical protein
MGEVITTGLDIAKHVSVAILFRVDKFHRGSLSCTARQIPHSHGSECLCPIMQQAILAVLRPLGNRALDISNKAKHRYRKHPLARAKRGSST